MIAAILGGTVDDKGKGNAHDARPRRRDTSDRAPRRRRTRKLAELLPSLKILPRN